MNQKDVLKWLEKRGTKRVADGLARFGIQTRLRVLGVSMGTIQPLAKRLKKRLEPAERHKLAAALWKCKCFEARMVASLVDDPSLITRRQMDDWAGDFDNWASCDTACFALFDRSPLAWERAREWASSQHEFVKRAAFALMASLALHDKAAMDKQFIACLPLIQKHAGDDRNFVKKGVNWALRGIGRRNLVLHKAALAVAKRLAKSNNSASRWVGKDALRELSNPKVRLRLTRKTS